MQLIRRAYLQNDVLLPLSSFPRITRAEFCKAPFKMEFPLLSRRERPQRTCGVQLGHVAPTRVKFVQDVTNALPFLTLLLQGPRC
jgi:hypothetical protein